MEEEKGYWFTVYFAEDTRIHGYVKAKNKEEVIDKIQDGDFDTVREESMGGNYDWDTLDIEANE